MSEVIILTIYLGVLIILAVCDVKTRQVPLAVNAGALFLILCYRFITHSFLPEQIIAAIVLFGVLWIGVMFWGLGGADAITGGLFGLYLGTGGVYAVILALLFSIPYLVKRFRNGDKKPDYAFIPYMAGGYGCVWILHLVLYFVT